MNQLIKSSVKKDPINIYKAAKLEFNRIKKKENEKSKAFDCFDFNSWLESKISNKPFKAVVKSKLHSL
jgi:hypothetical protein